MQYKMKYLDRLPGLENKATERGSRIHDLAERYVRGKIALPQELIQFKDDFKALAGHYAKGRVALEEEWGVNEAWEPCDWKTAWLRLKCDVVYKPASVEAPVVVIDHKTGRKTGNEIKHAQQLQLYAVVTLIRHPASPSTENELWYLDQNELTRFLLTREQMPRVLEKFNTRAQIMLKDKQHEPRPSAVECRWCDYAPHRLGTCPYGIDPGAPMREKISSYRNTQALVDMETLKRRQK
jgi:RecB family exonuclease